jgi:multiple antibiotic resistance protein
LYAAGESVSSATAWTEYTRFLIGLVAILDPFIAIPVFLSITSRASTPNRERAASVVALIVFGVLFGAALTGAGLIELLGGSLASFRVGGGLVLLLMALAMLNARAGSVRQTSEEADELSQRGDVPVVPLAIPLLAGPGAISTVIIAVHNGGFAHRIAIVGCIAAASLMLWAILRIAAQVGRALGTTGLNIANRLLGLLLAAIAVETMAGGLRELFPALAG